MYQGTKVPPHRYLQCTNIDLYEIHIASSMHTQQVVQPQQSQLNYTPWWHKSNIYYHQTQGQIHKRSFNLSKPGACPLFKHSWLIHIKGDPLRNGRWKNIPFQKRNPVFVWTRSIWQPCKTTYKLAQNRDKDSKLDPDQTHAPLVPTTKPRSQSWLLDLKNVEIENHSSN